MKIGVPREIKDKEYRVGLSPTSVLALVEAGHSVTVETGAGAEAGFSDPAYQAAGAAIAMTPTEAWSQEMIIKVKEPLPSEYTQIRSDHLLFTYLHLAASRKLTEALMQSGCTAIAYESVEQPTHANRFPLLTPMSVIAGRLSVQIGAQLLSKPYGGSGVLLSGVPGVPSGHVVILGGGVVGTEAARMALGLGAKVTIFDINVNRLSELEMLFGSQVELLYSTSGLIQATVPSADLLVGAVLVPGRRPPTLVGKSLVGSMSPGSVIVDVAVDQGGCIETLRPTSHSAPTYIEAGVLHYGVPNMPGAVPKTATQALNNSTLPYVLKLANQGQDIINNDASLKRGLVVRQGKLVHEDVRAVFADLAH